MAKKLTAKSIENMKPAPQRREISDGGSGLYLVVQSSGHRSWALRYRADGRPTKLTLGRWPEISLAGARKLAADALHELSNGVDPSETRVAAKFKADAAKANTLANVCEEYLRREGAKLRTVDQRVSILKRLVYPHLGDRPIGSIKRSDIVRLLDMVEDTSGPRMADSTLATIRRIFAWHATRDDEFLSPVVRGMGRQNVAEHRRSRILDDDEIRAIWAATATDEPFPALVRLALLTSARRGELAGLRRDSEVKDGVWLLPASRSKTKTEVPRPLSKAALALIDARPRVPGCPYVFTANGVTPIASFSGPKEKLDAESGVANWRLHDLRRTARSLLSRAGINSDIAERCLGHALPGIRATYDRHRYIEEMSFAFEALAALIDRIVSGADAAVIPMRR
jgi:integrase